MAEAAPLPDSAGVIEGEGEDSVGSTNHLTADSGDCKAPDSSSSECDVEGVGKLRKNDSGIDVEKSPSGSARDALSSDGGDSVGDCAADSTGITLSVECEDSPPGVENDQGGVDSTGVSLSLKSEDSRPVVENDQGGVDSTGLSGQDPGQSSRGCNNQGDVESTGISLSPKCQDTPPQVDNDQEDMDRIGISLCVKSVNGPPDDNNHGDVDSTEMSISKPEDSPTQAEKDQLDGSRKGISLSVKSENGPPDDNNQIDVDSTEMSVSKSEDSPTQAENGQLDVNSMEMSLWKSEISPSQAEYEQLDVDSTGISLSLKSEDSPPKVYSNGQGDVSFADNNADVSPNDIVVEFGLGESEKMEVCEEEVTSSNKPPAKNGKGSGEREGEESVNIDVDRAGDDEKEDGAIDDNDEDAIGDLDDGAVGAIGDNDDDDNAIDDNDDDDVTSSGKRKRRHESLVSTTDTDSDGESEAGAAMEEAEDKSDNDDDDDSSEAGDRPWRPKHKWRALPDLRRREIGQTNRTPPSLFREKVQGSLQMVQRLKQQYKMEYHDGCVNALHFNRIGTLLASGSDDLHICLWNWVRNRHALVYDSGHRSNVFQAKFMPFSGDCHVVSCARDGQVRLAELSLTGICKSTKKLAQHRGAAHKLALEYDSPHIFLSCGEDAMTYQIDLRDDKPSKLVVTKENDVKVALYSIHSNPVNSYEFCTGGRDHFIRIYDKRKINEEVNGGILKKYCPHHLESNNTKANVTCACYNFNGTEILGSYNDEDIYLFDNSNSDGANYIHCYTGHRNNATVKGVNFYGPRSEYIVSGSDCGHVYLWEKETEQVVQFLKADDCGVVNVLEPHPFAPVLATSGLDHDVKIWAPTAHDTTKLDGLVKQKRKNRRDRQTDRSQEPEMIDGQMLWFIMHHFRRSARRRLRQEGEEVSSSSDNSQSESDEEEGGAAEGGGGGERMQCQTS